MRTIHSYDYVNHPYDTVRNAMSGDVESVFSSATKTAASRARSVASELRINIGGIEISTDISISVKDTKEMARAATSPPMTRLQLQWSAINKPYFFPFMNAELSFYPLTPTETQLDFQGDYEVPMGAVGRRIDALLFHRIAEASVHRFVSEVAAYLRTELGKSAFASGAT
jgi:hypothetical protein